MVNYFKYTNTCKSFNIYMRTEENEVIVDYNEKNIKPSNISQ